jgi:RimJ/RimL family protein N-acetyltransferase
MAAVVFGPLIGPVFGYLAGVLVAGIFLVMDRLGARAAGSLWTLELEPFTAEDVDQLVNWLQSPSLLLHWADVSLAHPLGRAQIERRMKTAAAASPPRQLFKAVYAGGRQMAGYVELAGIDHESGCAQLERPLVAPGETDRVELSLALLRAVVAMAFGPMGLCRLETRVTVRNSAMLEAFRRVGFVEQGSRFQKNARDTSSQPYCLLIKSKGHRKGGDRRVATDRRR